MKLDKFIKFVSENYCVEVHEGKVELVPFNNMQMEIISEDNYNNYPYNYDDF